MRKDDERGILNRDEVLMLLSEKARQGQTGALIALERALRARGADQAELDEAIEHLLSDGEG